MADEFEDRLRQSLQARSQDVAPDPAMYREVQRRVRRGRRLRWSVAGAGAIAMVAVAALVVPSVLDRRIEFEPAPVATQPPEPAESHSFAPSAPLPPPAGMVFTDGSSSYVMALDGESAKTLLAGDAWADCSNLEDCVEGSGITAVAAAPDTTFERVGVAAAGPGACDLPWAIVTFREGDGPFRDESSLSSWPEGSCATAPVFSPDGEHLAWAVGEDGAWSLMTVNWTINGAGIEDAAFALDLPAARDVRLEDWVWTEESDTVAAGYLVLSMTDEQGVHSTYRQPIERQGDNAIALPSAPEVVGVPDGFEIAAFADSGAEGGAVNYTLEARPSDRQWRIVRSDFFTEDGAQDVAELDLSTIGSDAPLDDLWLSAFGDTVLYGDGHGQAWRVDWEGDGWGDSRALDATIVHADMFGEAPAGTDPEPVTRTVQVFFRAEGEGGCAAVESVARQVEGDRVARAALNELLAGPTSHESNLGYRSPFSAATANALLDITISDGVARADFRDFRSDIPDEVCTTEEVVAALEATLLQFPTVTATRFSFDGDETEFARWADGADSRPKVPAEVAATALQVREAAEARDYDALAELIDRETFSCSFSDQNEDCIALWQQQEAEGQDPLAPLVEILSRGPAKVDGAPIWAWPAEFVDGDEYLGPRTGIHRDGTWRYYQQGGD